MKKYNFQSHGLVPFDPQGQLIHKRRDHTAKADEVPSDSRQPTATTASRRWDVALRLAANRETSAIHTEPTICTVATARCAVMSSGAGTGPLSGNAEQR